MAAVSMDDIQQLIEAAVRGALQGQQRNQVQHGGGRLDERYFRRVDKFEGCQSHWKEWSFLFKTQVDSANNDIRNRLDEIQLGGKSPQWDDIFSDDPQEQVDRWGSELYSVLTSLMSGEALMVVRGVPNGNGWEAWSKLFNRYDPKTPARALMSLLGAMNPRKVKDIRELSKAVEEWEVKCKNLMAEHNIDVGDQIKTALLTSMVPVDLQDHIFQWTDLKASFPEMRDRILNMALNRTSMSKPTPMEVDRVTADSWADMEDEGDQVHAAVWSDQEIEIDYVGWGDVCRRCGGFGHYARDCPTPKGKGKGGKDSGGKGFGKDFGKGGGKFGGKEYGKGYKGVEYHKGGKGGGKSGKDGGSGKDYGKGKNFAGECWTCGERGHRSSECRKSAMDIGSVEESFETHVGGVWSIAQVQADEWQTCRSRKTKQKKLAAIVEDICEINAVMKPGKWEPIGSGDITVDSAAEESVCPKDWGKAYSIKEPEKWLKFTNASGGRMGHYGAKDATFVTGNDKTIMSLGFQVSDVQKPLAAVWRIAEKGNIIQFGPRAEDNFIKNIQTDKKVSMVRKGGSYVIEADFVMQDSGFPRQV